MLEEWMTWEQTGLRGCFSLGQWEAATWAVSQTNLGFILDLPLTAQMISAIRIIPNAQGQLYRSMHDLIRMASTGKQCRTKYFLQIPFSR